MQDFNIIETHFTPNEPKQNKTQLTTNNLIQLVNPTETTMPALPIVAFVISFITPFIGFILGVISSRKYKKDENGHGLSVAAAIIGGVFTAISIFITIIFTSFIATEYQVYF